MRVFSISSEAGTPDVPSPLTCPVGEHRAGDYDFADIVGVDGATASAQGAD